MSNQRLGCFLALVLVAVCPIVCNATESQPNVIVILTDDQGYGDMSCHGNPWLRTPNLDRMHAESVRLQNYHVDPVCTPTRAALMTGRYSSRVGAWAVTQGRQLLRGDEITMADVFAASGYKTAMFGKWHLGDTWPYAPRFRGFQEVLRHLAGGIDEIGNPIENDYFDDTYYHNGVQEQRSGYCTDVFFDACEQFITRHAEERFFVYLPLNAMHSPHTVADKYSAPFLDQGHPPVRAKFYGQIINFDENLGRLFQTLEDQGVAENTIVIFMGDNGTAQGFATVEPDDGFNADMRAKKGSVYDGGHRVACFVRWPENLDAGRDVNRLTCCRDWLPTLVEICDLTLPREVYFDGDNIAPLLRGNDDQWQDRTMFVERQADQPKMATRPVEKGHRPNYAVLTERWRLVNGELYDMTNDPGQNNNVASDHPERVEALKKQYEQYYNDVFANDGAYTRFPIGKPESNPIRLTVRDWHPTEGNVIWKQKQLADDALWINGFWAIDVARAGNYDIRVSRFPDDAKAPMKAKQVRLRVGENEQTQNVQPTDVSAKFSTHLETGHHIVQAWLTDETTGKQRGAYFVELEFCGNE
ncbi:arylsulfatase [Rhodopirellula sallentina]|uniref:N-acetylgalactosamine 6-sulfate sulfatase (GALNS) n=1 Tax=Rhodopirellula sallentina SM41 TaxID=1263870 RepID=M5TYW5_9BACT|nr:arylsulfatase [Rhodopirellula sallentina]EMI54395.1 N-acetylgalactosamine 6-sulfate sulfatase (GALNS) [Rhodopirellula sallentina SM41]